MLSPAATFRTSPLTFNVRLQRRAFRALFACTVLGGLAISTMGATCNTKVATTITNDVAKDLECVATAVLNGGIQDPVVIATMCTGLTIAEIVDIIDVLIVSSTTPFIFADAATDAPSDTSSGAPGDALPPPAVDAGPALARAISKRRLFNFTAAEIEQLKQASKIGHAKLGT